MFGNPGTTELPLMDGLAREPGIRYVLALQEAPAIAMTDGYAQASGGLGAVNVHVSPGLGNAMGMLYDAYKAGSPLLVTAGQHDQCFTVTEPILWSDLPPVARPYVKWSTEAHRLEDLPRIVRRAVKTALAHPTGPVFLSLPVDVLNAERDIDLGGSTRVAPRLVGDRAAIDEAARRLVRAERPLLVVGDAVAQSDALAELAELAELLGAPVVSEGVASTCNFPFSHPLNGGTFPRLAPPIRAFLMRHDLLCSIGGRPLHALAALRRGADAGRRGRHPHRRRSVGDRQELRGGGRHSGRSQGHAARAVRGGSPSQQQGRPSRRRPSAARPRWPPTRAERAELEQQGAAVGQPGADGARWRSCTRVAQATPAGATIVDETISSGAGVRTFFKCEDAKSFFGLRGGGIGWGLPAAIGVKLALPQRPVIGLIGDGSAMYTCQGLWTAAHDSVPVVCVIFNNASYRILKQRTLALKGFSAEDDLYVGMDLDRPLIDHVGLAKSFGRAGRAHREGGRGRPGHGRAPWPAAGRT